MGELIDFHCHILPGVDDGAKNMEEAMAMIRLERQQGVKRIVLTPHMSSRNLDTQVQKVLAAFHLFCRELERQDEPVKLYLGSEIYADTDIVRWLSSKQVLSIAGSRYVLVEFHPGEPYHDMERLLRNLRIAGYFPVLAHAERYICLTESVKRVEELIYNGALIQCNAAAVIGKEGILKKRWIKGLLKRELVHLVGTDAHGITCRPPRMAECYRYLCVRYGTAYADELCGNFALRILHTQEKNSNPVQRG